jgi:hypothetical protein
MVNAQERSGTTFEEAASFLRSRNRTLVTTDVSVLSVDGETGRLIYGSDRYDMTERAINQICGRIGVTASYVKKIDNGIAAENFNTFLPHAIGRGILAVEGGGGGESAGVVTGFLRESSSPIDPTQLVESVAERFGGGALSMASWFSDDEGLVLRMVSPRAAEPRVGDVVQAGVDVLARQNSNVSIGIRGNVYRLVCLNGAVAAEPNSLKTAIRRVEWQDPTARIELALAIVDDTIQAVFHTVQGIAGLTRMELDLPPSAEDRLAPVRAGLRANTFGPIKSKPLTEATVDATYQEEPTMFGLYNALTRIGRDSSDPRLRRAFEQAGFGVAHNPGPVFQAIRDALGLAEA